MGEEVVDTQSAPDGDVQAPEGQVGEPTGEQEPQPDSAESEEQEPQSAPQFDPDEFGEKLFQRIASWQGRREKELLSKLEMLESQISQRSQKTEPPEFDFEKPWDAIDKYMETKQQKQAQKVEEFNRKVLSTWGSMIQDDPLFVTETGEQTEYGKAVVAELDSGRVRVDRKLPPEVAAEAAMAKAVMAVNRAKAKAPKKPLAKNKPANRTEGGIAPPAAGKSEKRVELSEHAKSLARHAGWSEEDIAKMLGG